MSLITKYRPDSFGAVVGNTAAIDSIKSALDKTPPKRTFLLSGPRGTGKTTIARIIAKYVGCDIEHNFHEIDSADFRGIDTARELIKSTKYKGLGGGVKVYLLDEVHKFTKDAQEALLKTTEEPPEHVFIVLATTDPQLLKPTLVDRCLHCKTVPLTDDDGLKFLKKIVRREGKQLPDNILQSILEKAEWRPRSALNLLEKIIDISPDKMEQALEKEKAFESQTIDLCRALINGTNWAKLMNIIKGLEAEEPESIRRAVMGYCTAIMMKEFNETAMIVAECFEKPFYDNGRNDLILSCARLHNALERK